MQNVVEAAKRIATRVGQTFLKIGPADEPVAWMGLAATFLIAMNEGGGFVEDGLVAGIVAVLAALVRSNVTPAAHLPERYEDLPEPYIDD